MAQRIVTEVYKVRHFYDTPAEFHTADGDFEVDPAIIFEAPDEGPVELILDDLGRVIEWNELAYLDNWIN